MYRFWKDYLDLLRERERDWSLRTRISLLFHPFSSFREARKKDIIVRSFYRVSLTRQTLVCSCSFTSAVSNVNFNTIQNSFSIYFQLQKTNIVLDRSWTLVLLESSKTIKLYCTSLRTNTDTRNFSRRHPSYWSSPSPLRIVTNFLEKRKKKKKSISNITLVTMYTIVIRFIDLHSSKIKKRTLRLKSAIATKIYNTFRTFDRDEVGYKAENYVV